MIMFLLKLPFRLAAIPLIAALAIVQFFTSLIAGISSIVTNLIGLLGITAACCIWMFHLGTNADAYYMLAVGTIFILLPHIAQWLVSSVGNVLIRIVAFIVP